MGSIKQEIIQDLGPEINATRRGSCGLHIRADGSAVEMRTFDPNSWGRRNFSLYIDGAYGYDGQAKYEWSKNYVEDYMNSDSKMTAFVIRNFTEMVAFEYSCSYGYAQKCIVAASNGEEELEAYNRVLIADAIKQFS